MRYSIVNTTAEQVNSLGGKKIKTLRNAKIVFAELSTGQVTALRVRGCTVTPVEKIGLQVTPPVPVLTSDETPRTAMELAYALGLDEIRGMTEPPLYGEGLNLAIIGTGIRATHFLLSDRVVYSKNYTTSPPGDGFDHDTGVASIVLAGAPLCNILDIKAISDEGEGSEEDVAEAIDDLITLHEQGSIYAPHVINLSLGSVDTGNIYNPIRVICREAIVRGILIFASAGNSGPIPGTIVCPAVEQYVLAVGSARYEPFGVSQFSSRGPTQEGLVKPDAIMFGENVIMASSESDTATVTKSGTSFSCPFASAAGILFLDGQRVWMELGAVPEFIRQQVSLPITPAEMIDIFLPQVCIKPSGIAVAKDYDYGYGLPFGPLILEKFVGVPTAVIALGELILPIMMIGMMGVLVKTVR